MKKVDFNVATFETEIENFMIDVIWKDNDDFYEIWLYREDIGIKDFVVGCVFDNMDEVLEFAESYLWIDHWYLTYDQRFNHE